MNWQAFCPKNDFFPSVLCFCVPLTPLRRCLTVAARQLRSRFLMASSLALRCLSGLQTHKHWQEAIMLLTCRAPSLFMRTDSSLQTAARQRVLRHRGKRAHTKHRTEASSDTLPSSNAHISAVPFSKRLPWSTYCFESCCGQIDEV